MEDVFLVIFLPMLNGITEQHSSHNSVRWDLISKGLHCQALLFEAHLLASSPIQLFWGDPFL